jgi:hypothetical protein
MRWLLKLPFDQNHYLNNHTPNGDFKNHLIFLWTLNVYIELLLLDAPTSKTELSFNFIK